MLLRRLLIIWNLAVGLLGQSSMEIQLHGSHPKDQAEFVSMGTRRIDGGDCRYRLMKIVRWFRYLRRVEKEVRHVDELKVDYTGIQNRQPLLRFSNSPYNCFTPEYVAFCVWNPMVLVHHHVFVLLRLLFILPRFVASACITHGWHEKRRISYWTIRTVKRKHAEHAPSLFLDYGKFCEWHNGSYYVHTSNRSSISRNNMGSMSTWIARVVLVSEGIIPNLVLPNFSIQRCAQQMNK